MKKASSPALAFKAPTPEAERLFNESLKTARDRYREELDALRTNNLKLANDDFDTGKPTTRGEYPLADETYTELLDKLTSKKSVDVPDAMCAADDPAFRYCGPGRRATDKKQRRKPKDLKEPASFAD